ncbi:MAG TPA: hypothetical protein VGM37_19760 [Armatimonadota bacterium]|jgi:hypothetical protein
MEKLARYLPAEDAAQLLREIAGGLGADEVAVVQNLDYVYAPYELYPLAPKVMGPLDRIAAFAVDMDGTSTTTEPLCLHALEYMVRRFTARPAPEDWSGLDPVLDYPFVVGNSNFRHTEFLVGRYGGDMKLEALRDAFFEALIWTLARMEDPHRRKDIRLTAVNCGLGPMLDDPGFQELIAGGAVTDDNPAELAGPLIARFGGLFQAGTDAALVGAAMDVYYHRYHLILSMVARGEGERLSRELLGGRRLIEPMPGYAVFLALIKGWLGEGAAALAPALLAALPADHPLRDLPEAAAASLAALGRRFAERPARIGLVTASIAFEAHATIAEIFRGMREDVATWPLPAAKVEAIRNRLADYRTVYDGFVTATDSSEARLKPHRDLFAIALYQMAIPREDYARCIGLEDSEPGIISLRAAGIGCAVALPNHDTTRQNYHAAAHTLAGGLPELILARNLLLKR